MSPQAINHFDVMGIPASPFVDNALLKKALIQKQREVHPDTGNDSDESQDVNSSYEALRKPGGSVRSFLLLHISESQLNANVLPQDFLLEMMEISDFIDESKQSETQFHNADAALQEMEAQLQLENKQFQQIQSPIESNELNQLLIWFQKFQYLNRLRKNLEGIEEL